MKHLILSLLFVISIYQVSAFGQCTKGDCENGQGTYKYSDGAEYQGQWKRYGSGHAKNPWTQNCLKPGRQGDPPSFPGYRPGPDPS